MYCAQTRLWNMYTRFLPLQTVVAVAQASAKFASNESLKSVSYPIQALFKSSKTLPAMVGCLVAKKPITKKWIAALFICGGTAAFSMSGKKVAGALEASTSGLLLLMVSLACDGAVGYSQELIRNMEKRTHTQHGSVTMAELKEKAGDAVAKSQWGKLEVDSPAINPYEQMLLTNCGAGLFVLVPSIFSGQLLGGLQFATANPGLMMPLLAYSFCSAAGQIFIFQTISWFGPDYNAKITTVRKMATVLISIVWFGVPMATAQWICVGVVFAAVLAEIGEKMGFFKAASVEPSKKDN